MISLIIRFVSMDNDGQVSAQHCARFVAKLPGPLDTSCSHVSGNIYEPPIFYIAMKKLLKKILPNFILDKLKIYSPTSTRNKIKMFERLGYNVSKMSDYYSPLPTFSVISKK